MYEGWANYLALITGAMPSPNAPAKFGKIVGLLRWRGVFVSHLSRVVAKAEWTGGESKPRFVVTSLPREEAEARHPYKKI